MANSLLIYLNSKILESKTSFLQTICVLGYASIPIAVAALTSVSIKASFWGKMGFMTFGVVWSTMAGYRLSQGQVPEGRRFVALYPMLLFFMGLSWFLAFV